MVQDGHRFFGHKRIHLDLNELDKALVLRPVQILTKEQFLEWNPDVIAENGIRTGETIIVFIYFTNWTTMQ